MYARYRVITEHTPSIAFEMLLTIYLVIATIKSFYLQLLLIIVVLP